jgi:hypothetical protein
MIGTISIGRTMKESLQAADGDEGDETPKQVLDEKTGKLVVPPAEKERVAKLKREKEEKSQAERQARVDKLVVNLDRKLSIFVEGVQGAGSQEERSEDEVCKTERLVGESFKVRTGGAHVRDPR